MHMKLYDKNSKINMLKNKVTKIVKLVVVNNN